MEVNKKDIFSPANAVSLAGFALTAYGASHIGQTSGVIEAVAGRFLDVVDGPVARRTHSSEFGANLDATLDKAAVGLVAAEALHQRAAPALAIGIIVMFNVVNTAANVYPFLRKEEAATSIAGKRSMFAQNAAAGLFLFGHAVQAPDLAYAGWAMLAASTPVSIKASHDYIKYARQVSKRSPQTIAARNYSARRR